MRGSEAEPGADHDENPLPWEPREEDHREAGRGDQNGSAEVRLLHDQRHRDSDDQERDREVLGRGLILAAVEVPGKHHRERDLHQFRRLDLGDADIEPAVAPLIVVPITSVARSRKTPNA